MIIDLILTVWLAGLTAVVLKQHSVALKRQAKSVPRGTSLGGAKSMELREFKRSVGRPKGKKLVPKALSESEIVERMNEATTEIQ